MAIDVFHKDMEQVLALNHRVSLVAEGTSLDKVAVGMAKKK